MKLTLYGAANEVTGSCNLLEIGDKRLLIDCGMFQGSERTDGMRNKIPARLNAKQLDAVLLTHGHLDHCGRLPLLTRSGFRGPIYATAGTIEIAKIILSDAAGIQEGDTKRENRRRARAGLRALKPLFTTTDVERVLSQFREVEYDALIEVADCAAAKFVEAGHILGSACIKVDTECDGRRLQIVFSGDLGQFNVPFMRRPATIEDADIVVMEATYGDRDHRSLEETIKEFEDVVVQAVKKRSKILIPSFAVGRTQMILYYLAEMFRNGVVDPIPVFLDSPMAITASKAYVQYATTMDVDVFDLIQSGQLRKDLATLVLCETPEQSAALNAVSGPCIIIAGAGMCNAGRILHHLKHNLWKDDCYVAIVGYQAKGSLGRLLVEGAKKVKVLGETVSVRANIVKLGGFSAHAGQSDLLQWLSPMAICKPQVILNHGESHPLERLAHEIENRFAIEAKIPKLADAIIL